MIVDSITLSTYTLVAAGFAAAFLAALWVSLVIWTARDIRSRTRDPLTRILALLVVIVLFAPGVLIYLILRPRQTVDDEYQRSLEEEALLQTLEDIPQCPGCDRKVDPDWQLCPSCNTRLKKVCHNCGKLMELSWNICPYCATPAPGMRLENISMDEALRNLPRDKQPTVYKDPAPDGLLETNGAEDDETLAPPQSTLF